MEIQMFSQSNQSNAKVREEFPNGDQVKSRIPKLFATTRTDATDSNRNTTSPTNSSPGKRADRPSVKFDTTLLARIGQTKTMEKYLK
jgi:hypothetical protein